jgi:transcriptional regulator with XRE-family HTH domain
MGSNNGGGRKPTSPTVDDRHMTLQEIADILGTSRERVRQIEQRALGKLRRKLNAMGYKADDLIGQIIDTPARPTRIRPE